MGPYGQVAARVRRSGSRALGQRPLRVLLLFVPLLMLSGACESPVTPPAVPKSLSARAPINQFGVPGEAAFQSPQVLVYNQFGLPMKDVLVRFTVSNGSLERTEVRSDSLGLATPGIWTLGNTEGEDAVTAVVDGVEPLRFRSRVRVPVEVAHYALESLDGHTLPFAYGEGGTYTGGTFSFYADDTWLKHTTMRDPNGTPHTWQMQGSYALDNRSLTGADAFGPDSWRLSATVSGNRLLVRFEDSFRFDSWEEGYVKVRAASTWP